MCGSMADIQSATAEIRRGKKIERKIERRRNHSAKNIMVCPIPYGDHKYPATPQTRRYTTLWNICAQKLQ